MAGNGAHWMWYIFPQIQGLGFSSTSRFYAIKDLEEAKNFLTHELLGTRLIDICKELLKLEESNATRVFGNPDDLKLKSCMTLFAAISSPDNVFDLVLKKFFNGEKDAKTLALIRS